jgi:hypothetical protein
VVEVNASDGDIFVVGESLLEVINYNRSRMKSVPLFQSLKYARIVFPTPATE